MPNTRFQDIIDDGVPKRSSEPANGHDQTNVGPTRRGDADPKPSRLAFIVEGFGLYSASFHATNAHQIEYWGSRRTVDLPRSVSWGAKAEALITKLWSDWRRERGITRLTSSLKELDNALPRDVGIEHKCQIEWLIRHGRTGGCGRGEVE
ncbi:hypothetical protein N825_32315 [Skermanella stibiiresistens SB22]|uniref:Uncharacterized protein n=1 Tax=Skermanella stibiiresistens SB22 TaxID=1385369 RepID=W9GPT8_9PROT|nr:hypothetical protein [Skermanella stibiiresistens]EWY35910.1 hypothetical protein N825_32315 [Skermanella stibiiresistens SB22]